MWVVGGSYLLPNWSFTAGALPEAASPPGVPNKLKSLLRDIYGPQMSPMPPETLFTQPHKYSNQNAKSKNRNENRKSGKKAKSKN